MGRLATFETREGMEQAIEALVGTEVEGRPLFLREDRTTVEQEEGFVVFVSGVEVVEESAAGFVASCLGRHQPHAVCSRSPDGAIAHAQVGNLPWDMTPDGLRQVFTKYAPYDVHIKTNMSGRSRGG